MGSLPLSAMAIQTACKVRFRPEADLIVMYREMMMRTALALLFGLACIGTAPLSFGQVKGQNPLPLADSGLRLSPEQIRQNEIRALDGSPEAANQLANHYQGWTNDVEKAMYWYQIAAENGSTEAMWNYYEVSTVATFPDWVRRGRFWLRKAADLGDKHAIDELRDEGGQKSGTSTD